MSDREAMAAAELAEAEYLFALFDQAGDVTRDALGLRVRRIGGGVACILTDDPIVGYWSRVVGLGITEPITAALVDEMLDWARGHGAQVLGVQIAPDADGPWEQLLGERGLTAGRAWVKYASLMPMEQSPPATDLRIGPIGVDDAMDYGWAVVRGFGMRDNPHLAALFAGAVSTPGFRTYGAWDGDQLVAVAASHTTNCRTVLSGATTLPTARRRGAHTALIAARMADAEAEHSVWLTSQTGAETADQRNPALDNLTRMGLVARYERRNWIWNAQSADTQAAL